MRKSLAQKFAGAHIVNTYENFNGNPSVKVADTLADYRYSIVIESPVPRQNRGEGVGF